MADSNAVSNSLSEPIANSEEPWEQLERELHTLQEPDEIIHCLMAALDPKFEPLIEQGGFNVEKAGGEPFDGLSRVTGGLLGAMRLNGWAKNKALKYFIRNVGRRLPKFVVEDAIDRHDALLTFIKTRKLPSCIGTVEIYGHVYKAGPRLSALRYLEVCDGFGDLAGLYDLWPVIEDSRRQWQKVMATLKRRGVQSIKVVHLNIPSSQCLKEAGFIAAVISHYPEAKPLAVLHV